MRNFLSFAAVDLTFGEAALYSLIGFALILVVLAVLALLISLLNYLTKKATKKPSANKAVVEDNTLAPGSCGQVKIFDVADKDAAMIMAIVADELQTPLNELKFISIKEKKENKD